MTKVFIISFMFYPIVGGAEKQAEKLMTHLSNKNIHIEVVTARFSGFQKKEWLHGILINRIFVLKWIKGLRRISNYVYMVSLFIFLLKNRNKFDIMHCTNTTHDTFVCSLVAKILNKKAITKMGTEDVFNYNVRDNFIFGNKMVRIIKENISMVIAIDNSTFLAAQKEGIPKEKIIEIPNGVNRTPTTLVTGDRLNEESNENMFNKLKISKHTHIVTCVCRFRPEKGHKVLLKAWKKVLIKYPNSKLLLLGSGETLATMQSYAQSLDVSDSVIFTGNIQNVQDYLNITEIFVLPSFREGLSNALLEAMATGLPCIASNVGGNSDLISHDFNGLLFETGNSEQLHGRINHLLENNNIRKELGRKALQYIKKNNDFKIIAGKYILLYSKILY